MKHILNNISEEEKNAIREQHTGGMKLNTEKFKKLLETKQGDAKPFVSEQMQDRMQTAPSSSTTPKVIKDKVQTSPSSQVKTLTVGSKGGAMVNPTGNRPGHFNFVVKKVLGNNKYMVTISKWEFNSGFGKVGDSGTLTVGNKDSKLNINGQDLDGLMLD